MAESCGILNTVRRRITFSEVCKVDELQTELRRTANTNGYADMVQFVQEHAIQDWVREGVGVVGIGYLMCAVRVVEVVIGRQEFTTHRWAHSGRQA